MQNGNLASVTELSKTIHVGRLSGTLVVEFADGSRFLVDNNVVYSSSVHNKAFVRFPLTFHNVILADGNRTKQPSEERMHSIFCAAGELAQVALEDEAECEGDEIGPRPGC